MEQEDGSVSGEHLCDVCQVSYLSNDAFEEHCWSLMHHIKLEQNQNVRVHSCALCDMTCTSLSQYSRHLNEAQHRQELAERRREQAEKAESSHRMAETSHSQNTESAHKTNSEHKHRTREIEVNSNYITDSSDGAPGVHGNSLEKDQEKLKRKEKAASESNVEFSANNTSDRVFGAWDGNRRYGDENSSHIHEKTKKAKKKKQGSVSDLILGSSFGSTESCAEQSNEKSVTVKVKNKTKKKKKKGLNHSSKSNADYSFNTQDDDRIAKNKKTKSKKAKKKSKKADSSGVVVSESASSTDVSLIDSRSSGQGRPQGSNKTYKTSKSNNLENSRVCVSDSQLRESGQEYTDNGPLSLDDFTSDPQFGGMDCNFQSESCMDFQDFSQFWPYSGNWDMLRGHSRGGRWRGRGMRNRGFSQWMGYPRYAPRNSWQFRASCSESDERRRQWPVRDGPFVKPRGPPMGQQWGYDEYGPVARRGGRQFHKDKLKQTVTLRGNPNEKKFEKSGTSSPRSSSSEGKVRKSKTDSPVREDKLKLSMKASQIIDNILKGGSGKGLLGAFPKEPQEGKSAPPSQKQDSTGSKVVSKPPKAPAAQGGVPKSAPRSAAEKSGSREGERSCVDSPDRGAYLLERAETLCKQLREKRELVRRDNEKKIKGSNGFMSSSSELISSRPQSLERSGSLGSVSQRPQTDASPALACASLMSLPTRAVIVDTAPPLSQDIPIRSLSSSSSATRWETSTSPRTVSSDWRQRRSSGNVSPRPCTADSPRRLSAEDGMISPSGVRRNSPAGCRASRIPIPARAKTSESPTEREREKKGLDRDTIIKLVNTPRSRRDRKQISQMLRDFSKVHSARPKISLNKPGAGSAPEPSATELSIENVEEQEFFKGLPADVQLQISAMIANFEEEQESEKNPILVPHDDEDSEVTSTDDVGEDMRTGEMGRVSSAAALLLTPDVINLNESSDSDHEDCFVISPNKVKVSGQTSANQGAAQIGELSVSSGIGGPGRDRDGRDNVESEDSRIAAEGRSPARRDSQVTRDASAQEEDESLTAYMLASNRGLAGDAGSPPRRGVHSPTAPSNDAELENSVRSIFEESQNDLDESLTTYMLNSSTNVDDPLTADMLTTVEAEPVDNVIEDRDVSLVQSMLSFTDSVTVPMFDDSLNDRRPSVIAHTVIPIEIRPVSPEHMDTSGTRPFHLNSNIETYDSVQYQQERFENQQKRGNGQQLGLNQSEPPERVEGDDRERSTETIENLQGSRESEQPRVIRETEEGNTSAPRAATDPVDDVERTMEMVACPVPLSSAGAEPPAFGLVRPPGSPSRADHDSLHASVATPPPAPAVFAPSRPGGYGSVITITPVGTDGEEAGQEAGPPALAVEEGREENSESDRGSQAQKRPRSPAKQSCPGNADSGSGSSKQEAKRLRFDADSEANKSPSDSVMSVDSAKSPGDAGCMVSQTVRGSERDSSGEPESGMSGSVVAKLYEISVKEEKVRKKVEEVDGAISELQILLEKTQEQLQRRQAMKDKLLKEEERLRDQRMELLKDACSKPALSSQTLTNTADIHELSAIEKCTDTSDVSSATLNSYNVTSVLEDCAGEVVSNTENTVVGNRSVNSRGVGGAGSVSDSLVRDELGGGNSYPSSPRMIIPEQSTPVPSDVDFPRHSPRYESGASRDGIVSTTGVCRDLQKDVTEPDSTITTPIPAESARSGDESGSNSEGMDVQSNTNSSNNVADKDPGSNRAHRNERDTLPQTSLPDSSSNTEPQTPTGRCHAVGSKELEAAVKDEGSDCPVALEYVGSFPESSAIFRDGESSQVLTGAIPAEGSGPGLRLEYVGSFSSTSDTQDILKQVAAGNLQASGEESDGVGNTLPVSDTASDDSSTQTVVTALNRSVPDDTTSGALKAKQGSSAENAAVSSPSKVRSPKRRSQRLRNHAPVSYTDTDSSDEEARGVPSSPSPTRKGKKKKTRQKFETQLVKEYLHGESSTDVELNGLEPKARARLPGHQSSATSHSDDCLDANIAELSDRSECEKVEVGRHEGAVRCMFLWGDFLVTGGDDCHIYKFNVKTQQRVGEFSGNEKSVSCLHVSGTWKNTPRLYSGSHDKNLRIFNFATGTLNGRILFSHHLCCMHEANKMLYIGLGDGSLLCYDMQTNKPADAFTFSQRALTAITSVHNKLVIAAADCSITVRDLETQQLICAIEGHTLPPLALQVVDNSIMSAGLDRTLQLHDLNNGDPLKFLQFQSAVSSMSVEGSLLVVALYSGINHFYDVTNMKKLFSFISSSSVTSVILRQSVIYFGLKNGSVCSMVVHKHGGFRCQYGRCDSVLCTREDLTQHIIEEHVKPYKHAPCQWPDQTTPAHAGVLFTSESVCSFRLSNTSILAAVDHFATHIHLTGAQKDKVVSHLNP